MNRLLGVMSINRRKCVAILLMLLSSHAALALHVSSHVTIDQAGCDYCAGFADPTHAITNATDEFPKAGTFSFDLPNSMLETRATPYRSYRQRGPPALTC